MTRPAPQRWIPSVAAVGLLAALLLWANTGVSTSVLRLEAIHRVLELHSERMWRVRPGLDTTFEGTALRTDARGLRIGTPSPAAGTEDDTLQVLSLGASPTFGWGVEADETYAAVAEATLRGRGLDVEIRNAGQVGYASQQGLQLLEELLASETPDLITASWVVNDVDRLRFFLPNGRDDAHTEPPTPDRIARTNRSLHRWPHSALLRLQGRVNAKLAPMRSQRSAYELAHVRTTAAGYEANLRRLVQLGAERHIPVVLIVLPFHLPEAVPPEPPGLAASLARGREAVESGRLDEARGILERAAALDPHSSEPPYWIGRLHEARDSAAEAREAYAEAYRALINHCVRDAHRYNAIMRSVAAESGTPLVDTAPALGLERAAMDRYLPGDYIHPNAQGHRAVGLCLAPVIERTLAGDGLGLVQECE